MLSRHLPDLSALEVLLAVVRLGSISAAAGEIGVSQQAVSSRIASIEAQTGVTLIERTPQGSSLTPAGAVVAEWAAGLLERATEVDSGLAALRRDRRRRLRVSATPSVAEQLLPGWLTALAGGSNDTGRSDIALQTGSADAVADAVRGGAADLGFVDGPRAPKGLRSRAVGHEHVVLVVRPDHAWARRRTALPAAELSRTPLVVHGRELLDAVVDALRGVTDEPPVAPAADLPTTAAVRSTVLDGLGPAILGEHAVAADLDTGRLIVVPVAGVTLERTVRAVWRDGSAPAEVIARDLLAVAAAQARSRTRIPVSSTR